MSQAAEGRSMFLPSEPAHSGQSPLPISFPIMSYTIIGRFGSMFYHQHLHSPDYISSSEVNHLHGRCQLRNLQLRSLVHKLSLSPSRYTRHHGTLMVYRELRSRISNSMSLLLQIPDMPSARYSTEPLRRHPWTTNGRQQSGGTQDSLVQLPIPTSCVKGWGFLSLFQPTSRRL